jgi:hypothetical protein
MIKLMSYCFVWMYGVVSAVPPQVAAPTYGRGRGAQTSSAPTAGASAVTGGAHSSVRLHAAPGGRSSGNILTWN